MSVQDRNIHRDAQALRRSVGIELIVPNLGVDLDQPIYHIVPRYNWRLSDLNCWIHDLADAVLTVSAQAVPVGAVVGNPRINRGGAVPTFTIDRYFRHMADGLTMTFKGQTAAQAFTGSGIATVLDGFWGVWLIQVDEAFTQTTFAAGPVMAFATQEIALANCPKVFPLGEAPGRLNILTVKANGGDFIAGTTNTSAGVVQHFLSADAEQKGHVCSCPLSSSTSMKQTPAVLQTRLKDPSGTNILQGKGGPGGDALCVMVKCFGGVSIINVKGQAVVDYRPWPVAGEGLGDTSVSQNRPSFVP